MHAVCVEKDSRMSDTNDKCDDDKKKDKRGILRLDISKPRNSSGSVEFRETAELIGEVFCFCSFKYLR